MDLATEKKLVEEARKDPEKFGELFDEYYQTIFGYTLKRVVDVQLAQDITANVFYKAYRKLWQFKWRGLPLVAWLYRIAGNEIKSYYRKNRKAAVSLDELREVSGFEPEDIVNVEQELIDAEEKLATKKQFLKASRLIEKLDLKYREVLILRFFEDKKIREISEILGKKEGTVKSLVSRALGKLRLAMRTSNSMYERVSDGPETAVAANYNYDQVGVDESI